MYHTTGLIEVVSCFGLGEVEPPQADKSDPVCLPTTEKYKKTIIKCLRVSNTPYSSHVFAQNNTTSMHFNHTHTHTHDVHTTSYPSATYCLFEQ